MDISSLKPNERQVEILNPATGQPLGIRVTVMSLEDDRLKRIKRQITDESLKLQARGKSFKSDELERNSNALLFTATLGWEWYNPTGAKGDKGFDEKQIPGFKGEVPEYNQRNFLEVVKELSWFGDQIREAIDETRAFFEPSKAT